MFTTYYELKDTTKLPLGLKFIDPYDNSGFLTEKEETLEHFVNRILSYRAEKGYPKINTQEYTAFVEASLAEKATKDDLRIFFRKAAKLPSFAQVIGFAKTLAKQVTSESPVSIVQRKQRAEKCIGCPFNKRLSEGPKIVKTLSNIFLKPDEHTIESLAIFDEEAKLGTCGVCGCILPTKIKLGILAVLASITPEHISTLLRTFGSQAFSKCWMLSESLSNIQSKKLLQAKLRHSEFPQAEDLLKAHITSQIESAKLKK